MNKNKTEPTSVDACPRCSAVFVCSPENISSCHCSGIELNMQERAYIQAAYTGCLCPSCLIDLKKEYTMTIHVKQTTVSGKKMSALLIFCLFTLAGTLRSQSYHPAAHEAGTHAMHKDSSVFVNWAVSCTVQRGYQDISDPSLGLVTAGDASFATGKAQSNGVVSLGDGGWAICTFEKPITNGAGYDFAVFENGFTIGAGAEFLELAFVEVSSDGVNFFRFPAHSMTDTINQTGGFDATNPRLINNLAGKYVASYGTPFDLQELEGTTGLDVSRITHVKIIDVVGALSPSWASRDALNNKINDPWPTPYPQGGFDLDAVGVIHQSDIVGFTELASGLSFQVYPNPLQAGTELRVNSSTAVLSLELTDVSGARLKKTNEPSINTSDLSAGVYLLKIETGSGFYFRKIMINN